MTTTPDDRRSDLPAGLLGANRVSPCLQTLARHDAASISCASSVRECLDKHHDSRRLLRYASHAPSVTPVAPPVSTLSCRVIVWPAWPRHHADMNIEIVLTPTTGPIDEPLHGFVRGLPPGECVTVRAQLRDSRDLLWRSHLTLSAGRDGVATMDADAVDRVPDAQPERRAPSVRHHQRVAAHRGIYGGVCRPRGGGHRSPTALCRRRRADDACA